MKTVYLVTAFVCTLAPAPAEWRFVGPFGGSADIIRVARSNPDVVVAAARNGLIYRSDSAGASWQRIAFPGEHAAILHALAIDPTDEARWYAGVEDDTSALSGIYATADSGSSWSKLPGLSGKEVWSIAISPGNPHTLVAGTADGLYRSVDRGSHWDKITPENNRSLQPVVSLALDSDDASVVYAGTTHLPWKTADAGKSWQSIHTGMLDDSDVFSIVIHPENRRIVYASACSGAYRSTDSAASWSRLPTPPGTFRTYVVAVDPNSPNIVYAGTSSGLLQSSNEGKTWKKLTPHVVKSIDFDRRRKGRAYFASDTGGVLILTDADPSPVQSNTGFSNRTWAGFKAAGGALFVNSTTGGLSRSEDGGATWVRSTPESTQGDTLLYLAGSTDPASLLLVASRTRMWRSRDGGKSWLPAAKLPPGNIQGVAIAPGSANIALLATSSGLYRSKDLITTWTRVTTPVTGPIRAARMVRDAVLLVSEGATVLSRDSAQTWTTCAAPPTNLDWYGVEAKPSSTLILAATSHGLLRSTDDCRTWTTVRSGIEASTVMDVVAHPGTAAFVAAQRGRLLVSSDDGESWRSLPAVAAGESTPVALEVLGSQPNDVFALFARRGVARWTLDKTGTQNATGIKVNQSKER